ncbi:MAG: methylated-DNA--[protein]-cysteine S-methyltransferase [Chloroflexi bacterium]|nr:methylated-DNA--[protein]-cysteine S-methyltransferase [Chloroflexota bacterium]
MKHALVETDLGWAAIGIEGGKVCAAALPTTRELAEFAIADWGADEPASEEEAAPFVGLVLRAVAGEEIKLDGNVRIGVGTEFQRAVWESVSRIPKGKTLTYGELAADAGYPGAARAVGQAVGSNPIPLLIPCHRVVASNGIGGFGGDIRLKKRLLAAEGIHY